MKMGRKAVAFILVLSSPVSLLADTAVATDANDLTRLQDYLRYAALHNASVKAGFEQWKAALERVPQARSLPDPKFTYGYFIEEVETRVGPQRQRFDLSQTFPWFGTIEARTDSVAAAAKAARKRYEAKKLQLFRQVKEAFYDYSYLAGAIDITRENLDLLKNFEQVARSKYATSTTSHPDIIRAQIELAILEDRLRSLRDLRPVIVAGINGILNRPSLDSLPWPKVPVYQPVSLEFAELFMLILRNNPELQAVEHDIQTARSNEKLAEKKSYPGITLGVSYIDTAHTLASGVHDSGKDPIMAMISLNLPIWSERYKALQGQAHAEFRQKVHEKVQMENTLGARAQQVLYEFQDGQKKIRLYKEVILPKAEEMLIASESAYRAATVDFLSLIDAQRGLLTYQLELERLIAQNAQKLAELEMLAGVSFQVADQDMEN